MSYSLLGVFGAGLLTFLSPCVLPLAPILTASLIAGDSSRGARVKSTLWFALGFSVIFVLFGLSVPLISDSLGQAKPWLMAAGGVLLALFGLRMMRMISTARGPFAWMERSFQLPDLSAKVPRGLHGLVLGMIFAMGWTPCVGPVLGGVLTYVASKESSPAQGALMLSVFALGIALPLVVIAMAFEAINPWLQKLRRFIPRIEYVTGLGLFIFGVYLASQARFTPPVMANAGEGEPAAITAIDSTGAVVNLGASAGKEARMVFFYSETCPICHAMERYLPEFERDCRSDSFNFTRIDVGNPLNGEAASKFNVKAVPTVSMLDQDGKEILHLVGYQTEARLREAAKSVTDFICQRGEERPAREAVDFMPLPEGQACSAGAAC